MAVVLLSQPCRGLAAYRIGVSNLRESCDAIDFKGRASQAAPAAEELWDEQMFEFGASYNASAVSDAPPGELQVHCRKSGGLPKQN